MPTELLIESGRGGDVDLAAEPYISLTTFKRDGTPVSTPVWVAGDDGRLLVHSAADSWKVRRIRRDGHVRVAPCDMRGNVRGEAVDGEAKILADTSCVERLEAEKYGCLYRMIGAARGVARRVRHEPPPESVTIEIVRGDRA